MKKKQRTTPFDLLFPDTPKIKIRRILLDNREEAAGPLIKCQEVKTSSTLPPPSSTPRATRTDPPQLHFSVFTKCTSPCKLKKQRTMTTASSNKQKQQKTNGYVTFWEQFKYWIVFLLGAFIALGFRCTDYLCVWIHLLAYTNRKGSINYCASPDRMQHYIIPTSLPRSERLFARLLHSLLCTLVLNALRHSCRVAPGGGGANRYEVGMELDCDPRLLLCCLMRVRQPF